MRKKLSKKTSDLKNPKKYKVALITSAYHEELNKNMESACKDVLLENGILEKNIKTVTAPGSWEIPVIAEHLAATGKYDALATFGIIVKGDTYHFDMIANECGRALMNISLTYKLPVALEILAVNNLTQAKKRATGKYNKGIEAGNAIIETLKTFENI